jgi:molybdate transport system substrate-binding protein
MSFRRVLAAAGAGLLAATGLFGAAGCGPGGAGDDGGQPGGAGVGGTVTIFAAASLTGPFGTIAEQFEADHPGTSVVLNFAGSSALATQINQGAPADVFAAASPTTMKTVVDAGNAAGPATTFARNQLVIAVARGNPRGIDGLSDLARPGVKVALCAEQVPCGAAAHTALAAAAVAVSPVTLEQDVKAALSKVKLGEVDAALVYRTDVQAAVSDVDGVEFPESAEAINEYPIVPLTDAPNPAGAEAFVAAVLSEPGRAVLTRAGFQGP